MANVFAHTIYGERANVQSQYSTSTRGAPPPSIRACVRDKQNYDKKNNTPRRESRHNQSSSRTQASNRLVSPAPIHRQSRARRSRMNRATYHVLSRAERPVRAHDNVTLRHLYHSSSSHTTRQYTHRTSSSSSFLVVIRAYLCPRVSHRARPGTIRRTLVARDFWMRAPAAMVDLAEIVLWVWAIIAVG